MSYTKASLRTAVTERMDAVGTQRWSTSPAGELDQIISDVFDDEWKGILKTNRFYRMQKVAATSNATTGRIAISGLSTGSGDTAKRFYRVLNLNKDNISYTEVDFTQIPLSEDLGAQEYCWYREGENLMVLPKELNASFNVWVNYIPPRPASLSGESITVDFPDSYEWGVLVNEAAAQAFLKAGAETAAAMALIAMAEKRRAAMLSDLGRTSTNPQLFQYTDFAHDWGG